MLDEKAKEKAIAFRYAIEGEFNKRGIQSRISITETGNTKYDHEFVVDILTSGGRFQGVIYKPHSTLERETLWYWY
tara:strand:- start:221 stop:448 length:228 start_codon:yes stop_codon:yes gene_type:complete